MGHYQGIRIALGTSGVCGLYLCSVTAPSARGRGLGLCCPSRDGCCQGLSSGTEGWGSRVLRSDPASEGQEKGQVVSAELGVGKGRGLAGDSVNHQLRKSP